VVDERDLLLLLAFLSGGDEIIDGVSREDADIDRDGLIGPSDLVAFARFWKETVLQTIR